MHGGLLREEYGNSTHPKHSFFGWSNSNPIGCTFSDNGEVEIMVFRSLPNYVMKGVTDWLLERNLISTDFQIYTSNNLDTINSLKLSGNAKLNEPLTIFSKSISSDSLPQFMHLSSSLLESVFDFSEHQHQLSNFQFEIDVVDVKLMKHNILKVTSDYELDIVLRNRYDAYVPMNKSVSGKSEGVFKNQYIDCVKDKKKGEKEFGMKMDKTHKVLEKERYDIKTLESEIKRGKEHNLVGFHGLEPYEMAQYKVVSKEVLTALELEHKNMQIGSDISRNRTLILEGEALSELDFARIEQEASP